MPTRRRWVTRPDVPPSIESDFAYAERTLPAIWERRRTEGGDAACLWFPGRPDESWSSLDRRVRSLALRLNARGLEQGDRVALLMGNSPEAIVTFLALWRLGLVAVPLSPQLSGELLEERLRLVDARFVILDAPLVAQLPDSWKGDEGRVLVDPADEAGEEALGELSPLTVRPSDPALVLFTSGSSGAAKGCVISHHYAVYYAWVFWRYMRYTNDDTLYTCLPLSHCHALFASWWASVLAGGRLALAERFSATNYWREVAESRATACAAIGMMTSVLLGRPQSEWESRTVVEVAHVSAEGALSMPEFERRFGIKAVTVRYGSTEAMVFPPSRDLPPIPGLIGPAPADWEVALLDADGQRVSEGAGELVLRPRLSQIMFDEYLNAPEATLEAFRGVWFHTGDLVRRDTTGMYWFVGRATDTIRRRGENVSAWEVERAIAKLEGVAEVAAFALRSELGGDDLAVVAVPHEGSALTVADLERHGEDVLPRYMRPDLILVQPAPLPRTPSNKVDKRGLRERYGADRASGETTIKLG
jgi:carnitine-CoA ligase